MHNHGQHKAGNVSKRRAMIAALVLTMSAGLSLDLPLARADAAPADFPQLSSLRQAVMQRDVKKAMAIADEIVEKNPDNPNAYALRAELFGQMNAMDRARADLEKALSIDPAHPKSTVMFATLMARSGDTAGAMKRVDEALAKNKDNPELLVFRADLLAAGGKPQEAADVLESAAKNATNPQVKAAIFAKLAQLYGQQKMFKQASAAATNSLWARPDPNVELLRGQIHESAGDMKLALKDYESVQSKLGTTGGTPEIRKNLQARITSVKAAIKKQEEAEAKAKVESEVKELAARRQELLDLAIAYQNNPTDKKAIDALVAKASQTASGIELESEETIIPMHPSEYNFIGIGKHDPVNSAAPAVIAAQTKARELYSKGKINAFDDFKTPAEARKQLEEVIAIYPHPDALLRRSGLNFIEGDRDGAIRDAALSASIAALEAYQTKLMPQGFFMSYNPMLVSRRLLTQMVARAKGIQSDAHNQIVLFLKAVKEKDWLTADRLYMRPEAKWNEIQSPMGNLYARLYYFPTVKPAADELIVKQINSAVDGGNSQAVADVIKDHQKRYFTDAEGYLALYRAFKLLKDEEQALSAEQNAIRTGFEKPEVWLVLGAELEKEGKPKDAMVYYNMPLAGKKPEVLAKPSAQKVLAARNRLEDQMGAKDSISAYAEFADKVGASANRTRNQNLITESAITRTLEKVTNPSADVGNLYYQRGRTRYFLNRFDAALEDFNAIKSTNKHLLANTQQMIGATYGTMAEQTPKEKAGERKVLFENAIVAYTKGIEIADYPMIRFGRASCYMELKQEDLAEKDFQSAGERFPDTEKSKATCYFQLSKIKHGRGDIPGAFKDSEMAMSIARKVYTQVPMEMTFWALQLSQENLNLMLNKKN